jgi:hypothetical protein
MRRNELLRIDSEAVQGPDSYVVLRKPTWKAMKKMMKAQAGQTDDTEIGLQALETVIPDLIVDWNWAKEDGFGEPVPVVRRLPLPAQDATVMDELDLGEMMFLMEHVTPLLNAVQRPN